MAWWTPGFIDYLYVSVTNSSAFSPTDTMPLSPRAKLLMATECISALLTSVLVMFLLYVAYIALRASMDDELIYQDMLKAKATMEIAWLQASTRRRPNGGFLAH